MKHLKCHRIQSAWATTIKAIMFCKNFGNIFTKFSFLLQLVMKLKRCHLKTLLDGRRMLACTKWSPMCCKDNAWNIFTKFSFFLHSVINLRDVIWKYCWTDGVCLPVLNIWSPMKLLHRWVKKQWLENKFRTCTLWKTYKLFWREIWETVVYETRL